jgi:hypothetical protein
LWESHNNNTFTWSGPSGVLDCSGQRPLGRMRFSASQDPNSTGWRAVPLNLLNRVW